MMMSDDKLKRFIELCVNDESIGHDRDERDAYRRGAMAALRAIGYDGVWVTTHVYHPFALAQDELNKFNHK